MERVRGRTSSSPAAAPTTPAAGPKSARTLRRRLLDDLARVPTPEAAAWPPSLAGLVAGLWAALMSWLAVAGLLLLGWVFAPLSSGDFGDVMRLSASTWMVANGGTLRWQGAVISLPPLLLTIGILLLQRRAGGWLATASGAGSVGSLAMPLAFGVAASMTAQVLVAATATGGGLRVELLPSALGAGAIGALGLGWGLLRAIDWPTPAALAPALLAARRFLLALAVGVGVILLLAAALRQGAFRSVVSAIAGDAMSTTQVLLLCLAYLPTLAGWVLALLLGPGFGIGAGTAVSVTGVTLGALPPIPLLALIPADLPGQTGLLLLLPALAGWWAAAPLWQARDARASWAAVALLAVAGATLGWAVSGGMGPGRLAAVGPLWWQLALATVAWPALGLLLRWASTRAGAAWAQRRPAPGGDEAAGTLAP